MMGDESTKADKLMEEAEKKGKNDAGLFGKLFGETDNLEKASKMFLHAAHLYKMAKNWDQAGEAFLRSANLKIQTEYETASCLVEAANCFRKTNIDRAVDCFLKAIDIYTNMGRFTMAAKHHLIVAELFESDCPDLEKALFHYEKAADYYQGEESKCSARRYYLKVAEYAATLENYIKAIEIFQQLGASAMDHSILKFHAKEYFLKALLCHLCVDLLNGQLALKRYNDMYPRFTDTQECKLIKDLILCIEEGNFDRFTAKVRQHEKICRLDPIGTMLLLRIKKTYSEEEELDLK